MNVAPSSFTLSDLDSRLVLKRYARNLGNLHTSRFDGTPAAAVDNGRENQGGFVQGLRSSPVKDEIVHRTLGAEAPDEVFDLLDIFVVIVYCVGCVAIRRVGYIDGRKESSARNLNPVCLTDGQFSRHVGDRDLLLSTYQAWSACSHPDQAQWISRFGYDGNWQHLYILSVRTCQTKSSILTNDDICLGSLLFDQRCRFKFAQDDANIGVSFADDLCFPAVSDESRDFVIGMRF